MKVNIHITTYIFLLISFLSGYFEYMFLLLLIIFIHESGHAIIGMMVGFSAPEVIVYPFGGVTHFNEDLNVNIIRELLSLLGGIFFQVLFFLLCSYLYHINLVTFNTFYIIKKINYLLISFNFLPILPLDGGKLLNILLDTSLNYRLSNIITIILSIIFIIIFILNKHSLFSIILTIFLIKSIYLEIKLLDYKYHIFLFERYKNKYSFKHIRRIKNIKCFKREYSHIINGTYESKILNNMFDRKS